MPKVRFTLAALFGFTLLVPLALLIGTRTVSAQIDGQTTIMSSVARRSLAVVDIAHIGQACDAAIPFREMRFGARGQTLLASCGDSAPLGGLFAAQNNLHVAGDPGVPPRQSSARVFSMASGDVALNIGPPKIAIQRHALVPAAQAMGYDAWLVGTDKDEHYVPSAYISIGNHSRPLTSLRSQVISAAQLDAATAAVLYMAWPHPEDHERFPDVFVARVNIRTDETISNQQLQFPVGENESVVGAEFRPDGIVVFHRVLSRDQSQAQWYVGGSAQRLAQTTFAFDGSRIVGPRFFEGASAGEVFSLENALLLVNGQTAGCPQAIAAIVSSSGSLVHCFRRSVEGRPSDHLMQTRPSAAQQYSYTAMPMDGGRYIVIIGEVGIDDLDRDPDTQCTAYLFDATGRRYLGSVSAKAIATADDAPLIATMTNAGDVTIHRVLER
jgi:hypothetical protein